MLNLASQNSCVGCTACVNACPKHCIEIKKDADGFGYPKVICLSECINCGACEKACPVLRDTTYIERLPLAYAAISTDEAIRFESSSGGVFSELAKWIIAHNGVVYGAVYDEQFRVHHSCVTLEEDIAMLRGAKYAESDLEKSFSDILVRLKKGQLVLFSGTPCQVAGLKSFIRKDYDNLFCIDFVCHGVPSPMAWKSYIDYRAKEDANGELPCKINLRSKNTGWSQYQYSNVFEYGNGKIHSTTSSQSLFMRLFVGDYISRPSCTDCKFKGYNRVSDITLGDFWGIWDIDPEMDDNKGTSVILVHSEKGQALWRDINSKIKCKEVLLEQASQQNPSMLKSSVANIKRELALDMIRNGKIAACEEIFATPKVSLINRIKGKVKRILKGK